MRKLLAMPRLIAATAWAICFFGGCTHTGVSTATEQARITSPDGQLDAVVLLDSYGPPAEGGNDWDVYITTKGTPINTKTAHVVFRADPLTGGQLAWKENHLLEIHYDIADIHEFRNLWGLHEVVNVGPTGERDFEVEIRLVPSADFSVLNQNGSFRSRN
jgi:hypothetical protein